MSTVSDESATRLFGEFCGAGLWPGVGRAMAEKLQAAGITSPDDVTAGRLELVEGIGPKRAVRLAAAFTRAQPAYETAGADQLPGPGQVRRVGGGPARPAGG